MFSRLTIVRLKAAENALKDGRLDEAFRLATAPDLREHRRAQTVMAKSAKMLIERAKAHYGAGLYDEAIRDLDRAAEAQTDMRDIHALRDEIREAARQSRHHDQQQRRRVEAARQRIEAGSLLGGDRLLHQVDADDAQAGSLRKRMEANAGQARIELDQAEKLLKADQVPAAVERLLRAQSLNARDPRAAELEGRITRRILDAAQKELRNGRTDRTRAGLNMLGKVGRKDPLRQELERNVDLIARVSRAVAAGQHREALRFLKQLRHLMPDVKWIKDAEDQVTKLCDMSEALRTGPLGVLTDSLMTAPGTARPCTAEEPTRAMPHPGGRTATVDGIGPSFPSRLLMLVDGVGSFLVLAQDRVSIGRMTSEAEHAETVADIPLMADISRHHADIARMEDDYFIFPHHEVMVDGRRGGHRPLFHKNRINLSKVARLTIRIPNPKSATAVLDLSSRVQMNKGVRQVLLFDRLAVVGAGRHCHVVIPSARRDLILYNQNGKLWLRPQPTRPEDRFDPQQKHEIRLGESINVDGIGFCFLPWSDEAGLVTKTT